MGARGGRGRGGFEAALLVAHRDELAADAGVLGAALAVVAQAVDSAKNMPKPPHLVGVGFGSGWG